MDTSPRRRPKLRCPPRCQGSGCEQKARAGRATFASDYSLGPGEAPLLSFDPGNWEAPFAVPGE